MKQLTISLIYLFCLLSLQAANTPLPDLNSLKKGDWFELECTQINQHKDFGKDGNPWSVEGKKQVFYKITVSDKQGDLLQLSCKIDRLLNIFEYKNDYILYDTNFPMSPKQSTANYFINKDSLIIKIDLNKKEITEENYQFEKESLNFECEFIKKGFLKYGLPTRSTSEIEINTKELYEKSVITYINNWLKYGDTRVKTRSSQVLYYDNWREWDEMRITNASYTLMHNVNVICHINNATDSTIINFKTSDDQKIKPISQDGNKFRFAFFMPNPQSCWIYLNNKSIALSLTPNDSLIIDIDESSFPEKTKFSGLGSAACQCTYELREDYWQNYYFKWADKSMIDLAKIFEQRQKKYEAVFSKYKNQMSRFWRESKQKDLHYRVATELFIAVNIMMKWNEFEGNLGELQKHLESKHLCKITPMIDYLYSSGHYHTFLEEYIKYQQLSISSNNFSTNILNFGYEEKLLLTKMIFRGYPKYYCSQRIIAEYLQEKPLTEAQKEYDWFRYHCHAPKFNAQLKNIYDRMEKIQADQSIKDLNISIAPYLNLKEKADGYILLNMNNAMISYEWEEKEIRKQDSIFTTLGFEKKAEIVVVRRNFIKEKWANKPKNYSENVKIYFHEKDSLIKDTEILKTGVNRYMLLRNDGTILHNNINTGAGSFSSSDFYDVLLEDLNKPEANNQADTRRLGFAILFTLLFSGLIAWGFIKIRSRQIKKKEESFRRLAELELKVIRSQMNPHFLFNALSSIQHLINKNKIEKANIYLSRFADMMRLVLNNSAKELISLADELKLIQNYLELEKLRVPFEFNLIVDSQLNPEEDELPGMLIQPFVENAVVHGIAPKRNGHIDIRFTKNKHYLKCEVVDDGIGINQSSTQNSGNGKAIKMIQERVNIVNSQSDHPFSVQLIDRSEEEDCSGTTVLIKIPI
ncbi:sensor histidine kinase [Carboxylicivirga marina]|uniref:sensor histidine kinase n=1 Tax=Carboxylicivirga marina TaxID=2800988 RepID=UPI00259A475E|nr:histidine kinase [uncultured Carboxylicivirga sp.]